MTSNVFRISLMAGPLALIALLSIPAAEASLIVTYAEDSNSYVSTLTNTTTLAFDTLTANAKATNLAWTNGAATIGTIDQVYIRPADGFGGAGISGSNYAMQSQTLGGANATPTTTLTFNADHAYFGFWWSAGDNENVLTFYSGATMVAQFTTATLLNKMASSPEYYGNPRNGQNAAQPYAFINFFGMTGTTWNRIVFSNLGSNGFESDNWTDRIAAWGTVEGESGDVPGVKVTTIPEISSALCLLGTVTLMAARRQR